MKEARLPFAGMMKKPWVVALVLFLLIPVVTITGGILVSVVNPEIAAGHPNYVRNYHLLDMLKMGCLCTSFAIVCLLWVLVCILVVRAKGRSYVWLVLGVLGPLGFAVLASLKDLKATDTDSYTLFLRKMNWIVRGAYEVLSFAVIWEIAWQAMILKSTLQIRYESMTTGASIAQINAVRDASSGMWAFGEGMEVMYLAVLLYLLRPFVFRIVAQVAATMRSRAAQ